MNHPYVLYHMVRADFLERVRRYSFLVTLAAALYLAWAVAAEKVWIVVGNGYRGVYNSAWIGMLMTICCSLFLSLVGFYIVKNSIQRDTDTRVGRILAATPMRKEFYTLAKALSNFAMLACMVLVLMLAALVMQLLRAEARPISLWNLWSPFVLVALPAMFVTASLALLCETLPILRSGAGNVFYFFFWTALLALGVGTHVDDPLGLNLMLGSTRSVLQSVDPSTTTNAAFSVTIGGQRAVHTFLWPGIDWTAHLLLGRLLWIAVAVGIALLASVFFHRFDPAREWRKKQTAPVPGPALSAADASLGSHQGTGFSRAAMPRPPIAASGAAHLTPLPRTPGARFPQLVISELKLMLKGQRWWWYAGAIGLLIGQLASPDAEARMGFLLVAWIWPVLIWSAMGCREARHATGSLLFSSERALTRQLPALWTAGVIVTALTGGGVAIRQLLSGDQHGLAAWAVATLFIPSLALALGVWSGSGKPFEAIYTVWWYMGPGHQLPRPRLHGPVRSLGPPRSLRPSRHHAADRLLFRTPSPPRLRLRSASQAGASPAFSTAAKHHLVAKPRRQRQSHHRRIP